MLKKIFIYLLGITIFSLINTTIVLATSCDPALTDTCEATNGNGFFCEPDPKNPTDRTKYFCQENPFKANFGKVQPPDALKGLVSKDSTGAFGISQFLSNLIALFYSVAAIVLIFMLLWGAFEWMTSGGDKEKIESARRRIISAIIGIILFAVAFAVIQILGQFTGFKFFVGQK